MATRLRTAALIFAFVLVLNAASFAAPGQQDDPVATQSYAHKEINSIIKTKIPTVFASENPGSKKIKELNTTINALSSKDSLSKLAVNQSGRAALNKAVFCAKGSEKITLPKGTVIYGGLGTTVKTLSGTVSPKRGSVFIDLTAGRDITYGTALGTSKLYMSADKDQAIEVTSDQAVLTFFGYYRLTLPYVPQFTDLCEAMMQMGLINTYALERDSTRLEMMVLFVTLLGERAEAEAYSKTHPFTDLTWGDSYVSYLYDKGYSAGTGGGKFSPNDVGSVSQYATIIMRALGYKDNVDMTYKTAHNDIVRVGVFSQKEISMLMSQEYTRDTMIYMSYYALFAKYKGSNQTVLDKLVSTGYVSRSVANNAIAGITRIRL